MRTFFLFVFVLLIVNAQAQKAVDPQRFAKTITPADLKKRLAIVAGPEMEGRETGTEGQHRAAAYIEGEFKKLGLAPGNKDSYQMYYNVYQDSLVQAGLQVGETKFQPNKDFSFVADNMSAMMRFSKAIVFAPNAIDSMRAANLTGRLVVLLSSDPQSKGNPLRSDVYQLLRSKGPAALRNCRIPTQSASGRCRTTVFSRHHPPITGLLLPGQLHKVSA